MSDDDSAGAATSGAPEVQESPRPPAKKRGGRKRAAKRSPAEGGGEGAPPGGGGGRGEVFSFSPDDEAPPAPEAAGPASEGTEGGSGAEARGNRATGAPGGEAPPREQPGSNERRKQGGNRHRQKDGGQGPGGGQGQGPGNNKKYNKKQGQGQYQKKKANRKAKKRARPDLAGTEEASPLNVGSLAEFELFSDPDALAALAAETGSGGEVVFLNDLFAMPLTQLVDAARAHGVVLENAPTRADLLNRVMATGLEQKRPLEVEGVFEHHEDGFGLLVYAHESYRVRGLSTFVPDQAVKRHGLRRGHVVRARVHPPREGETCPFMLAVEQVMGMDPEAALKVDPFEELIPYYPLERILLETDPEVPWDNISMRVIDLLTPVGRGQRGLIVAPPRTGKTVVLQGIANAVGRTVPDAHLIVLLVDERPEEVTDFQRQVTSGEVVSSTFDEDAESHVHAAEMVIEKARRMVEAGRDVIILLDSITRLARAYNQLMPNSGKILSGGMEASALQRPKRFFGSARNIEGGGSLTILGTALVETNSKMDEVIFEEFKGTGNMELHLDRALVDKRIFPAINLEKSGTRKEELLYHPQEMEKIYSLRRAMKGVPSPDAMEMLIGRVKKTGTNAEFLMGLNR